MAWAHDQLADDLAEHLRGGSKRITWLDMQLGPSGSPRPDVYTMEPTYTRLSFEAFECKVSAADFRSDVTSGKWQSYLKYANSVTFAVPAELKITKDMVPASCGLIVRGATWRYAKKPVRQVLHQIPWQAWIKLLLDGVDRSVNSNRLRVFSEYRAHQALAKKFGDSVADMLKDLEGLPERLRLAQELHDQRMAQLRDWEQKEQSRISEDRGRQMQVLDVELVRLAERIGCEAKLGDLVSSVREINNSLSTPPSYCGKSSIVGRVDDAVEDLERALEMSKSVLRLLKGDVGV